MFKEKRKVDPYEGLHGKELIDAIMEGETVKMATREQYLEAIRLDEQNSKKLRKRQDIIFNISYHVKPIFFTPLAIMFHTIAFVTRFIGGVASVGLIYGFYRVYKLFAEYRAGVVQGNDVKVTIAIIVFPFIAFTISKVSELAWSYFEDNKY